MKVLSKALPKVFLITTILILAVGFYLYNQIYSSYKPQTNQVLIPRGSSFAKINTLLTKKGIVKNSSLFYRYAKFTNSLSSLQAGRYTLPQEISIPDLIDLLKSGSQDFIKVTVPEGKNLFEIAHELESKKIILSAAKFIQIALKKPDSRYGLPSQALTLEGFLYPDTYYFSESSSSAEVLFTMTQNFHKQTTFFKKNFQNLNWFQLITLASIVEKETGRAFERPLIAGVFYNRLKKGMRLQSDPTTIYGIFERFDGNLRKKDLLETTDYNTYKIKGLPKGPIANPGQEAIKAVLEPKSHRYIYFVSKNDGTHIFSENYEKHRQAVNFYQKRREKN